MFLFAQLGDDVEVPPKTEVSEALDDELTQLRKESQRFIPIRDLTKVR